MSDPLAPTPPIVIHDARIRPGRPPSARLSLDLELENAAGHSRWALLPGRLPPAEGGVFAVETLRGMGSPQFVAARILGTGGRLVIRVAPRSRIRLREAGITWWGSPPIQVEVVVEFADEVLVGGRPLESWLAATAEALPDRVDASLAGASTIASRMTDDLGAVLLELRGTIATASATAPVVPDD